MTIWNPRRHPDQYPAAWHSALQAGPGEYLLLSLPDGEEGERELKIMRKRFHAFCASLRSRPYHPSTLALSRIRSRVITERHYKRLLLVLKLSPAKKVLGQRD